MAAALAPPDMYACSSPGGSSHAPSFLSAHQSPYVSKFTLNALERIRVQANADDSPQVCVWEGIDGGKRVREGEGPATPWSNVGDAPLVAG
eukprot:298734-Chlamydomonas_euryale.AAC.1